MYEEKIKFITQIDYIFYCMIVRLRQEFLSSSAWSTFVYAAQLINIELGYHL